MTSLLVIEENAELRRMIRTLVEGVVGRIEECDDGSQVPAVYREARFDWVLIDIRMKKRKGLAVAKQIKEIFPEAKLLIISEYDDETLREAASVAGASHYVIKERLIDITEILDPRRG
jgi:CheY-like chemotaxis protein